MQLTRPVEIAASQLMSSVGRTVARVIEAGVAWGNDMPNPV
jgi:hypothetical protein